MFKTNLISALVAAIVLSSASVSAFAAPTIVYQSANFVDESNAVSNYIVDSSNYVGARFTLNTATDVSYIGGNFSQYSDGNVFGAIVNAGDWGNIATNSIAHTTFAATGGDQLSALGSTVHLAAGTYDVVFGSGLFGTTGYTALVDSQDAADTSAIFQSTDAGTTVFALSGTSPVRVLVAVPETDTYAMLLAGLGIMGVIARRRQTN